MELKEETKDRKTYLDILRVIACLMVIYNHVSGRYMRLHEGMGGGTALFCFYLSKAAVPLFLMISGAVLLQRSDSYRKSGKRLLRMILTLVLFSTFYYGMEVLRDKAPFQLGALLFRMYNSELTTSLWYLYLYIGVLLMMPVLQKMTGALERTDQRYFIGASLIFSSLLPTVYLFLPAMNSTMAVPLFAMSLGMLMAGHYLDHTAVSGKGAAGGALLCAVLPLIPTLICAMLDQAYFGYFDNYFLLTSTGAALGIFVLVRYVCKRLRQAQRFWAVAGRLTFGTFLMGDFLIEWLAPVQALMAGVAPVNMAGIGYTLLVFGLGMGITYILINVPLVNKLL